MEQIIINHADGSKTPLFSRKNISAVSKATQKIALLSEDVVSITITTATPLDLMIGDTTLIYGKKYKLNQLPQITKNGERNYTYELTLEGAQYDLIDVQYHLPEDCYGDTFYSDLGGHLEVLMWNISRVYPGLWKLGNYPKDTEYTNFTATEKNCLAALQEHCTNYGVEFEITSDGKTNTLNIKAKAGITHTFTLKYGRGRGLYQLSRTNVNNAGITNRLFIYGGTENLGKNYGHTKLCLPGTTRLTSYLEDAESIAAYGIKENEKNYTNIKPGRIGTVTALGTDKITFIDNTMFDLNAKEADGKTTKYLIEGTNAKIKFESGQLAGYEFDLHSYEHGTHKFVINKFQDENGTVFPSETSGAFQISVGDKYSILDIQLPQEYITEAENDLKEAGTKDFETMTQPQVSYKLALTEGFFISLWGKEVETEILHVGDFIPIEDEQIGVNKAVRITRIERDLLKRHSYDITLSDTVTKSTTVRVLNEIEDLNEVITINKLADPARARRRWLATQELLNMVFDPEGDYYSEKIKPLSIETQMLSVGAKSTQFTLQNITFQPNYGGNPNSLYVSSGTLVHYAIEPDALKLWALSSATFTNLTSATAYYIYAKCPKNGDSGTIVLSATAKTVEAEAGYYNFLVGVLNSVVTDTNGKNPGRLVSLTYGSSTINGRFIRTGRIESSGGGKCYFDLDNDEIGGVIHFVSSDGTTKNVSDLDQIANETKNYINNTLPGIMNEIQAQLDGKIESWFQSSDPATNWTTTALKKAHVGDMWYSSSTKLLKRYTVSGSAYSWTTIEDQKAIDAYTAASKAQDTADGKRQVFVTQPKPPYDIGDLWLTGGKTDGILKRCITKRTSGSYVANDWVEAVYYDNTQTTIDGGIVTAGTVQLAGSDASIKAGITGEGTADTSVRFWAGASKGNRATAPFRVLQDGSFVATKGTITGTINANAGSIGGFAIASGRIGVAASSGDTSGSGLALLSSFIKFSDSYRWASIGTNVLPASTGLVGVGRFTNKTPNSYGTNYGLLIEASGALVNLGIVSKGAIVCDSYVADYGISKLLPSVNTCLTPGDATKPTLFKLMPRFIYSNSGIGLPRRDSICTVLGISNYTAFAVRITIICDRTSTQIGYVCGRNTFVKNSSGGNAMDSNYYPYRMNNNAGNETGKWNMAAGDIREFLLVWDGSSGYYAYLLNIRE
ncbi:hypothetical protein C801_03783 [Bacteroides uniformis dnLKV2]|uniref:Phage minor structural protein n=1 Tax=Bacteroides uniformis dnLKV2 TaxID=1235787 RepID=R9HPL0_BACUN|nr:hypothetical protein [Bacteroides uniformis]EOS05706.1 hypothetical protein C801_03783 [Bacteroides uniformis dnLKV2]